MSRVRNLVIGCDGTWNEPQQINDGKPAPTNVTKFLRALPSLKGHQRKHYEKGVGTRAWEALPGGIYGYGLDKRVLGGYRFLRNRFADSSFERKQNRVFIIGFSRGAYTARRIAGLVAHSGIPEDSRDTELGWEMYRERDLVTARALKREGRFFDVPVEMVGVWDTVKATNDPAYHDQKLPRNVVASYHAMAIDERRKFFPILRWNRDSRVLQVWFAGVHSDIGGGYTNAGLSDTALNWMIYRAHKHGLRFKRDYPDKNLKPSPSGAMHNSFKGIWRPLGERARTVLKKDFVHQSVEERLKKKPDYQPKNLPEISRYWPPRNENRPDRRSGLGSG